MAGGRPGRKPAIEADDLPKGWIVEERRRPSGHVDKVSSSYNFLCYISREYLNLISIVPVKYLICSPEKLL